MVVNKQVRAGANVRTVRHTVVMIRDDEPRITLPNRDLAPPSSPQGSAGPAGTRSAIRKKEFALVSRRQSGLRRVCEDRDGDSRTHVGEKSKK